MKTIDVLLAEDNHGDIFLIEEALRVHQVPCRLQVLTDGVQAGKYLERMARIPDLPCPDVFPLDLNLPKGDGHEILNRFRRHPLCGGAPVIVITSSAAPKDRHWAKSLGVSAYFRKPSDLADFMELGALVTYLVNSAGA